MSGRIAIYGAGAMGRELAAWMLHDNVALAALAYFVDSKVTGNVPLMHTDGHSLNFQVKPGSAWAFRESGDAIMLAIADPLTRYEAARDLGVCDRSSGAPNVDQALAPSYVHGSCVLASKIWGNPECVGNICAPGVVIGPDCTFGSFTFLNVKASIGHDCRIGSFVTVHGHANICGGCSIGHGVTIGAGATILPGVIVGRHAKIGAGSVVVSDVAEFTTVFGNPARVISS